jgi:hypothetical protein
LENWEFLFGYPYILIASKMPKDSNLISQEIILKLKRIKINRILRFRRKKLHYNKIYFLGNIYLRKK